MCIICVKPAGISLPAEDLINNMWENNPDGAGYMYPENGKTVIRKGFMSYKDLQKSVKSVEKRKDTTHLPMIFHFRIGTSGGNIPACTHPFPVTTNIQAMRKLKTTATLACAMNGIIPGIKGYKKTSDTMEYISEQLAYLYKLVPNFWTMQNGQIMVANGSNSKWAFMSGAGKVGIIGDFIEDKGLLFSNSSYKKQIWTKWDNWNHMDKYWDDLAYISVMPLYYYAKMDGYIALKNGDIDDAAEYYIDATGQLYVFDNYFGALYPSDGTPVGFNPVFDMHKAIEMEVIK